MVETPRYPRSRANSVRTARSTRSARSRSRPSRPTSPELHRAFSHLDDASIYHPEHAEEVEPQEEIVDVREHDSSDSSSVSSSELSDEEKAEEEKAAEEGLEAVAEYRDGIRDERDLEVGPPIEKKKTEEPERDPNLVSKCAIS